MSEEPPGDGPGGDDVESTVTIREADGLWIAEDDATGISSQAHGKADALRNLAAALETIEEGEDRGGDDWL